MTKEQKERLSKILTTKEVAELLRTSPQTLRYWRHIGKGPKFFRPGRNVLYDYEDVMAWLEEQKAT